jgi:uncharacterized membrane protein
VQTQNYLAFLLTNGDLGDYNQAFSTTVHGQGLFYYTVNIPSGTGGSLFAAHFSPFLFLLVPFYALAPTPVTLIALKQAALALGALPLYGIARVYFERRTIPIVFAALYLISPLTVAVDWNSFDPEAFIPLALLIALYFFIQGRFWWFLAAWLVTLSTIESIPALLALFAIGGLIGTLASQPSSPWLTRVKERRFLLAGLVASIAWLGIAYLVLAAMSPLHGAFGSAYGLRYTRLGASSFLDVLPQAVLHPGNAAFALQFQGSQKLLFLELIILASGAVSLLGGLRYLLPLAGYLVLALLSNSTPLYVFGSQYTAYVSAILFVGAVEGSLFLLTFFTPTNYVSRRAELETCLRADIRLLEESMNRAVNGVGRSEEAAKRLRLATSKIEEGDLAGAAHQVRRARRILLPPRIAAARGHSVTDGSTPAPKALRNVSRRVRAWGESAAHGGANLSKLAVLAVPIICILVAAGLANPLLSEPAAGGLDIAFGVGSYTQYDSYLHSVIQLIPAGSSVLTTPHIFTEISNRPNAYTLPDGIFISGNMNYSATLNRWANQSEYILTDYAVDPTDSVVLRALEDLPNSTAFHLCVAEDEAYLYSRNCPNSVPPVLWREAIAGGSFDPVKGISSVSHNYTSSLGPSMYHAAGGSIGEQLWSGPSDVHVPPGIYSLTFDFMISAPSRNPSIQFRVADKQANITETQQATTGQGSHNYVTVGPRNETNSTTPLITKRFATSDPNWVYAAEMLNFTWSGTGYLNFIGVELSQTMSMYLLSVELVQVQTLP